MNIIRKEPEFKLVDMLSSIETDASKWRMLALNFSDLQEHYQNDYQMTIAVNLIRDDMGENDGQIFLCQNNDIVLVCTGAPKNQLEKLIFRLRYLFSDDPLSYDSEGQEAEGFFTLYDLGVNWQRCYDQAKVRMIRATKFKTTTLKQAAANPTPGIQMRPDVGIVRPLTPSRLVSMENDLAKADMSRVMRRQPICAIRPEKGIIPVFEELYINITHLRKITIASVDLSSDRWLFKYLTQILDYKVLNLLTRNTKQYLKGPVSINLNLNSILSEEFAAFDAAINPKTKASIVLEIQIADVFIDIDGFMQARDFAQKKGYRICLDGLNITSFTQIDRKRLGFDLAKVQWNADRLEDLHAERNIELKQAIDECGAGRMILCRCDNKSAIDYGQALGIALFQGRYLDQQINPESKVVN